jgi:putative ABC transport system permease protein
VFISNVLAEKYSYQIGDPLTLRTRLGTHQFQVMGTIIDFSNQGMVVQGSWMDMERYFRLNDANTFLIKTEEGYAADDVKERIDRLYRKRYQLVLESNDAIRAKVFALMDQAFSMFDVLALLAIVVASLGVINTLTMNVLERTRELGMLRAVGMTRGQVVRMVLAEAVLIGLIGGVLGLIAGVVLTHIFLMGMNAMSGYQVEYIWAPGNLVLTFVAALIISQLAAIFPARRAARVKVLEAVHYE